MQCGKIIFKSDSLQKSYGKKVISNLSLDIYNGDRIVIVGKMVWKNNSNKNYKWRNRF